MLAPILVLLCCRNFFDSRPSSCPARFGRPAELQLFGHHSQGVGGGDEVHLADAPISFQGEQHLLEEDRAAGPGGGNRQLPSLRLFDRSIELR